MKKKFQTELMPSKMKLAGGFGSSGNINPSKLADEVFGEAVPGPWLACYMIRRFGWPNLGSDPYKNLFSWALTTPFPGLYLTVTPYLGGSNLHFGACFDKAAQREIYHDPGRESWLKRRDDAVRKWWLQTGRKTLSFGVGKIEGDEDTLAFEYHCEEEKGLVWGLWERKPEHSARGIPKRNGWVFWWLTDEVIPEVSPKWKAPKMTKRERAMRVTPAQKRMIRALEVTLADLLRPTNVRDIEFTPFGDIERTPEAIKRFSGQEHVRYFADAGHSPSYLYGKQKNRR